MDNRSDNDHKNFLNDQEETLGSGGERDPAERPDVQIIQDDCPDGLQYEDDKSPYNNYDGYALPSDDEEPVYIRAMSDEGEASTGLTLIQFDNVDWKSRWDTL